LAGELYGTVPGGPTRTITGQNIFPPEDLGNQGAHVARRTLQRTEGRKLPLLSNQSF